MVAAQEWDGAVTMHAEIGFSTDTFFLKRPDLFAALCAHRALVVEMEVNALYAAAGLQILAALTVLDIPAKGQAATALQRETNFAYALPVTLAALS